MEDVTTTRASGPLLDLGPLIEKIALELLSRNDSKFYTMVSSESPDKCIADPRENLEGSSMAIEHRALLAQQFCQAGPKLLDGCQSNMTINPNNDYLSMFLTHLSNAIRGDESRRIFPEQHDQQAASLLGHARNPCGAMMQATQSRPKSSAFVPYQPIKDTHYDQIAEASSSRLHGNFRDVGIHQPEWQRGQFGQSISPHLRGNSCTGLIQRGEGTEEDYPKQYNLHVPAVSHEEEKVSVRKNGKHGKKWMSQYAMLKAYVKKHKCYPTISSGSLGKWTSTQRTLRKKLKNGWQQTWQIEPSAMERIRLLEELAGWTWDHNEPTLEHKIDLGVTIKLTPSEQKYQNRWMEIYLQLKEFVDQQGALPMTKKSYLGKWIRTQRVAYHSAKTSNSTRRGWPNSLVLERKILLEKIPGWTWDASEKSANKPNASAWISTCIDAEIQ